MAERETSSTQSPNKGGLRSWRDKFQQQDLEAWQPIFTAQKVWGVFTCIGLLFIAIGIPILITTQSVVEYKLEYTNCTNTENVTCKEVLMNNNYSDPAHAHPKCTCSVPVNLTQNITGNIYMYYGLDNFYQNHRRYVASRDDRQLVGKGSNDLDSDCNPYDTDSNSTKIAPCGSIANSMFNDTLTLKWNNGTNVIVSRTDISWPSDRSTKFQNPDDFVGTAKPPSWEKNIQSLGEYPHDNGYGYQNEDFIVWMRTAAFPNFRKLYAKIDGPLTTDQQVILDITYTYPVDRFDGKKYMILSNASFFGGKNNFLGIAYMTVGSICVLLGIMFFIIHQKFGKGQNFQNTQS